MVLSCYLFGMYVLETASGGNGLLWAGDDRLGPGNQTVMAISILLAVLCGIQGFSYLFSQDRTDFYFSLPVRRRTLFSAAYWNGFLIFAAPCLLSHLLSWFIKDSKHLGDSLFLALAGFLVAAAGFLLFYHITLLAVLLTGNIVITGGLLAFFVFYVSVTFGVIVQMYSKMFFQTFYQADWLKRIKLYLSPLDLYQRMAGSGEYGAGAGRWSLRAHAPYLAAALGLAAVLYVLVRVFFYRRPAEAAGKAIAFPAAQPVLRFLLVVPLGLMGGYFFRLCGGQSSSVVWVLAGILVAVFTFHGLAEVIFQFRFRAMLSRQRQMLLTAGVCALIACSFYWDLWRYDSYLPEEGKISSVSVSIKGMDDTASYSEFRKEDLRNDLMAESRFRHMELTGERKSAALEWIRSLSEHSEGKQEAITYAAVAYHMKNGSDIYRQYPVTSSVDLEAFQPIYESGEYKAGTVSLISYGEEDIDNGYEFTWSNGVSALTPDLSGEEKMELFACYRRDLEDLSMEEATEGVPLGMLNFSKEGSMNGGIGYIYPSFTETVNFLKGKGIPADKRLSDYEILKIVAVTQEKESGSWTDYGRVSIKRETIDSKAKIKALEKRLMYQKYGIQPLMQPYDMDTDYQVIIKGNEGDTIVRVNCVALK